MGLGDAVNGSSEPDREETDDGDYSGTYVYFYEEGHEDFEHNMNPRAYDVASQGGQFRNFFKRIDGYGSQAAFLSHIVVALDEYIENRNMSPLLDEVFIPDTDDLQNDKSEMMEIFEPSASDIAEYLSNHDEVADEIREAFEDSEDDEFLGDVDEETDEAEAND